ncbi:MAG: two-component system response regulator UvrY [Gammaproteobacteria bacterium]|jgi:two-component system invasion response regulator UvrY|nr:two-component system response regulator UvrY [Gammaproteobacteria bacterium]
MTKKLIKVLLVDDHQLIRYSLKESLSHSEDIEIIGDVGSGEEAIEFTRLHHPDVILMDLRMPGMGGLKATEQIAANYPESRILVVSSCDAAPYPATLLAAGAIGFVSKNSANDELISAVRAVADGIQYLSPEVKKTLSLNKPGNTPFSALSNEELRVTLMLIRGEKGKHIAEKMHIEPKTVSAYRSRIYGKLSVRTDVALALLAIRYGIVDEAAILKK